MLSPKKIKWRKTMRGVMSGVAGRGTDLSFGEYGIQAAQSAWITNRQIEAARIAMTRKIKRGGKVWIRVFPDKPYTRNLLKHVWVLVKVHLKVGWLLLKLEELCLKWAALNVA